MNRPTTCYMCDAQPTSVEHVPPKCLFPAQKDLPPGVVLRHQLITVPSCDAHNGAKSKDDLYLQYALVFAIPTNVIGRNHFAAAVRRRIDERPALATAMMENPQPVVAVDKATGIAERTVAVDIDRARLDGVLEHVGRGLHFHHFGTQWTGPLQVHPEFLMTSLDPAVAPALNAPRERFVERLNEAFAQVPFHGANPDVFRYQVIGATSDTPTFMRLHFYGDVKVTLIFNAFDPETAAPV